MRRFTHQLVCETDQIHAFRHFTYLISGLRVLVLRLSVVYEAVLGVGLVRRRVVTCRLVRFCVFLENGLLPRDVGHLHDVAVFDLLPLLATLFGTRRRATGDLGLSFLSCPLFLLWKHCIHIAHRASTYPSYDQCRRKWHGQERTPKEKP